MEGSDLSARASRRVLEFYKMLGAKEEEKEVDFFFYADELNDALDLINCLKGLHYSVECVPPEHARDSWLITGQTQMLKMQNNAVVEWTETMEKIARNHHARFDGWGTLVGD